MSDTSSTTSSLGGRSSASLASPSASLLEDQDEFYVRYNVTRQGRAGPEFMEYELLPSGKLRYANNANYGRGGGASGSSMIRREVFLSPGVVAEFRRIVTQSGIISVNDETWKEPRPRDDCQEIECRVGSFHIAFSAIEVKSVADVRTSPDPSGLQTFYYLGQDLKTLFHTLISCHFKARPFG